MGFTMLTVIFVILAIFYEPLTKGSSTVPFMVLFTLGQLFFNFGPNATTFIVPGEVFPTKVRSTAHGIAAASGSIYQRNALFSHLSIHF
jgi:PHS family inorganic phosphate transporter-like MFS transporter